jgi:hypothetical protein
LCVDFLKAVSTPITAIKIIQTTPFEKLTLEKRGKAKKSEGFLMFNLKKTY